jgi:hypothetical protein
MSGAILDLRFAICDWEPRGRDSGRGHDGCELAGFLKKSGQAQHQFFFGHESPFGSKTGLVFPHAIANRKSKIANP